MVLIPASLAEIPVDGGLFAGCRPRDCTRANVSALPLVLVSHNVVVLHRVRDLGPVERGQIAEVGVLFNAYRSSRDVGQAVEADFLQLDHFEHDQGVVEEEVVSADDGEAWEEVTQTLQAVDAEEEQVIRDQDQLWEAQAPEVLQSGLEHEQDFQVALDHRAVLHNAQLGRIIADIYAGANCNKNTKLLASEKKESNNYIFIDYILKDSTKIENSHCSKSEWVSLFKISSFAFNKKMCAFVQTNITFYPTRIDAGKLFS